MRINFAKRDLIIKSVVIIAIVILLFGANLELFHFAEGSGNYFGEFSMIKGLIFLGFAIFSIVIFVGAFFTAWKREQTGPIIQALLNWRGRIPWFRWFLVILILFLPNVLFQYTEIGIDVTGYFFRIVVLVGMALIIAYLVTSGNNQVITSSSLGLSLLLISCSFIVFSAAKNVVDYPFSLGWSEGNRIWNHSILFGRERYDYPSDQPIFAFVDKGRQSLFGVPFLFPNVSIQYVRVWGVILITLPYAILGWLAFRRTQSNRSLWILGGIWAFVFLSQGPVYTPLVLTAILVTIAWRSPLWIALPLIAVASFYAQLTRFTWMFAPALWIGMLYLGDIFLQGKNRTRYYWGPAFGAIVVGLLGADIIPRLLDRLLTTSSKVATGNPGGYGVDFSSTEPISVDFIIEVISRQPLIWNRLFPNPTYSLGILLALSLITVPLIIFFIYLVRSKKWSLDQIQRLAILIPLTLFLIVGLIISVKIGGGADLHNMDMFLIGLVFVAALAWKAGADQVLINLDHEPKWIQYLIILLLSIYAIGSVISATPLELPTQEVADKKIARIRHEVSQASKEGEILFIDQRQLLTFGNIENVPLVTEYEKVYLMNQAMAGNASYFEDFHDDISNHRFRLIISEPLRVAYQGSDHHFGDENDAWVKWVSEPVLCYYEPIANLNVVRTQLLVPRVDPVGCP